MKLLADFLLVKEVISDDKIEGTSLSYKYDDTDRYMYVEVIDRSKMLEYEYCKQYKDMTLEQAHTICNSYYRTGNKLIISRVAKTPYKDGTYFISYKDIIAVMNIDEPEVEEYEYKENETILKG